MLKHIGKWLLLYPYICFVHTMHIGCIDLLNDSIVMKMSIFYILYIFYMVFIAHSISAIRTLYRAVNHCFIFSSVRKQSITPTRGEHFPNTQCGIVLPFDTTNTYQQGMILLWPHVVYTQWWYIKKVAAKSKKKNPSAVCPICTKVYILCYKMEYIDESFTNNNFCYYGCIW